MPQWQIFNMLFSRLWAVGKCIETFYCNFLGLSSILALPLPQKMSILANMVENRETLIGAWVHFSMELSKNISHKQVLAHSNTDPEEEVNPKKFMFFGPP